MESHGGFMVQNLSRAHLSTLQIKSFLHQKPTSCSTWPSRKPHNYWAPLPAPNSWKGVTEQPPPSKWNNDFQVSVKPFSLPGSTGRYPSARMIVRYTNVFTVAMRNICVLGSHRRTQSTVSRQNQRTRTSQSTLLLPPPIHLHPIIHLMIPCSFLSPYQTSPLNKGHVCFVYHFVFSAGNTGDTSTCLWNG